MIHFNNWEECKIIRKDQIMEFDFLEEKSYIQEIEDGYFYLTASMADVERRFYTEKNEEIASELNLVNVQKEISSFIKKLNRYNRAKDISQALMGKIAELKGITIRDIHEQMGIPVNDDVVDLEK